MGLRGASPSGNASASLNTCPSEASQVWSGHIALGKSVSDSEVVYLQMEEGSELKVAYSLAFEEGFSTCGLHYNRARLKKGSERMLGGTVEERATAATRTQGNRTHIPKPLSLSARGCERGLEGRRLTLR